MDTLIKAERIIKSKLTDLLIARMTGISRQTIRNYRVKSKDLSQAMYKNVVKLANLYDTYKLNHLSEEEKNQVEEYLNQVGIAFENAISNENDFKKKAILIQTKNYFLKNENKLLIEFLD